MEWKYPELTVLVKDWMIFLGEHRIPRSWCRTSPDIGYLREEGYRSIVVYQRPGSYTPQWLRRQRDRFRRLIRRLDHTVEMGGDTAKKARDAARLLTVPDGAYSYLPGVNRGRLGRGGPGANQQNVRNLLVHYLPDIEQAPEVTEYRGVLQSEAPYGIETTGHVTRSRSGREWYDVLTPEYEELMRQIDKIISTHPPSLRVGKAQRIRQKMDMPGRIIIPGTNIRLPRRAPRVPPIDLRAWFQEENVTHRAPDAPSWAFAARGYLDLVTDHWADIPREIRYTGDCENSRNESTTGSGHRRHRH